MPNRPSALKRLRQNEKRRVRNQRIKSRLRTEQNKFDRMVERGDLEDAREQCRLLTKLFHQAAARNILHANKAARKQGQFERRLNQLEVRLEAAPE